MEFDEQERKELGMRLLRMCGWEPGKKISRAEALLVLLPFMAKTFGTEYAHKEQAQQEQK